MKTNRFIQTNQLNTHPRHHRASRLKWPFLLLAVFLIAGSSVRASDPIGAFGKIDKVMFEPNDSMPDRVQLWGTFCMADPRDRDSYLPPEKGYLYYQLPGEKSEVARKEWKDLQATAGTGEVIGFGSRFGAKAKVRAATDEPENPDVYSVGFGLVKTRQRSTSYPPIKALMSGAEKKSEKKESPSGAPAKN